MSREQLTESQVISICTDCVYFNEYGRLDDQTMSADPQAAEKHRAKIAHATAGWSWGTVFTSGCGRDCPNTESDGTGGCYDYQYIDAEDGEATEDGEALQELEPDYEAEPEPWFSWSSCDQCGSGLGGDREHATATTYISPYISPRES